MAQVLGNDIIGKVDFGPRNFTGLLPVETCVTVFRNPELQRTVPQVSGVNAVLQWVNLERLQKYWRVRVWKDCF